MFNGHIEGSKRALQLKMAGIRPQRRWPDDHGDAFTGVRERGTDQTADAAGTEDRVVHLPIMPEGAAALAVLHYATIWTA